MKLLLAVTVGIVQAQFGYYDDYDYYYDEPQHYASLYQPQTPAEPLPTAQEDANRDKWIKWDDARRFAAGRRKVKDGATPTLNFPFTTSTAAMDMGKMLKIEGYGQISDHFHRKAHREWRKQFDSPDDFKPIEYDKAYHKARAFDNKENMMISWLLGSPADNPFGGNNLGAVFFLGSTNEEIEYAKAKQREGKEMAQSETWAPLGDAIHDVYRLVEQNWGSWRDAQILGLMGQSKLASLMTLQAASGDLSAAQYAMMLTERLQKGALAQEDEHYKKAVDRVYQNQFLDLEEKQFSFTQMLWGNPEYQAATSVAGSPTREALARMAPMQWHQSRSAWSQATDMDERYAAEDYFDDAKTWPEHHYFHEDLGEDVYAYDDYGYDDYGYDYYAPNAYASLTQAPVHRAPVSHNNYASLTQAPVHRAPVHTAARAPVHTAARVPVHTAARAPVTRAPVHATRAPVHAATRAPIHYAPSRG